MNPIDSLNRITQFNNLYVRYVDAQYEGRPDEANKVLMEMAHVSGAVQEDLDRVNQGIIVLKDAPAEGGRHYQARLVDVVVTRQAEEYNIEPTMIQVILRQAIGEYERLSVDPEAPLAGLAFGLLRSLVAVVTLPLHGLAAVAHYAMRNPGRNLAIVAAILSIVASLIIIF